MLCNFHFLYVTNVVFSLHKHKVDTHFCNGNLMLHIARYHFTFVLKTNNFYRYIQLDFHSTCSYMICKATYMCTYCCTLLNCCLWHFIFMCNKKFDTSAHNRYNYFLYVVCFCIKHWRHSRETWCFLIMYNIYYIQYLPIDSIRMVAILKSSK